MELDYASIKALASPTRIAILKTALEAEHTPTSLADTLGKAKSTVTSHASTLTEAGLLERKTEEGRKRVVYQPTRKAKAIAHGKTKQVTFALSTAGIAGLSSTALFYASQASTTKTGSVGTMTAEAAGQAQQAAFPTNTVFVVVATILLLIAFTALWYAYHVRDLHEPQTNS